MSKKNLLKILFPLSIVTMLGVGLVHAAWEPPSEISREEIIKISNTLMAMPEIKIKSREEIFRIRVLDMDWDIGGMVYEPEDPSKIPMGPDGKRIGAFFLHGGSGDHRSMEKQSLLVSRKFGYKVATMTYPGRLYLLDPGRNWPGDTIKSDGTVRTPIWKKDELITRDQYEVIKDASDLAMRKRYGTQIQAKAKEGTVFYYRMAAWPVAFEEAMKEVCRRNFPEREYSIYANGHSTGGPFVSYLIQRVPNIVGYIGMESTPFSFIYARMMAVQENVEWKIPFYNLTIRTWRDVARYEGPQALAKEGPSALRRLPMLIEEVFEKWERETNLPQIKAEYPIHYAVIPSLIEAARVTAKRLKMSPEETENLVKRYIGYTRNLEGPGVKPIPPLFLGISKDSRDHTAKIYKEVVIPMYGEMKPAPKVRVVRFDAGVHDYMSPEKDLPMGPGGAVVKFWDDAIKGGYFMK
jgi:hypothetical protein